MPNKPSAARFSPKSLSKQDETGAGGSPHTGESIMEVILKEDVLHLGHRGDLVKVADGYARNYLLPRKLAMQATLSNKAVIEQMKASAARRFATEKAQAEVQAAKLEPVELEFTRKSSEAGHLFGSVTSSDIAAGLASQGFEIDRRKIHLDEPLKSVGEFNVAIRLYREVTAHVKVKVLAEATEEEAKPAEPAAEAKVAE
jgi:large subunit ribosomal protein L9